MDSISSNLAEKYKTIEQGNDIADNLMKGATKGLSDPKQAQRQLKQMSLEGTDQLLDLFRNKDDKEFIV